MAQFRKKPVVVEAEQFYFVGMPAGATFQFWRTHGKEFVIDWDERGPYILIPTLEGQMRADQGDWIIQGVKGELYPCKPDVFAASYDLV